METRQGRLGPISDFINEPDGEPYIASTIPCRSIGIRVTGKEQEGFDSENELMEGFDPSFTFDVALQTCVYRLRPKRKKIFLINYTGITMSIQDFHALIVGLLERDPVQEMYGAVCRDKYEQADFAAVPAKMGFFRKKHYVFLIPRSGA